MAVMFVKVCSVIKNVFDLGEIKSFRWFLSKPVVLDLFDLRLTVSGQLAEPSDRIALSNPEFKPSAFIAFFDMWLSPNESSTTLFATKSLLF